MDYTNRFINNDGFEEWMTQDENGNDVHCYANRLREIHTKVPVCECGRSMTEEVPGRWACRNCDIAMVDDDFVHFWDSIDAYENYVQETGEDYGEFKYDDGRRLVGGTPNCYAFYRDRPLKKF